MERIMSIITGGGISYILLSLGAMLLTTIGVDYHFSPVAGIAVFPALIAGLWWSVHRANCCYDFEGLRGHITTIATNVAVIVGLVLAAHVTSTIY